MQYASSDAISHLKASSSSSSSLSPLPSVHHVFRDFFQNISSGFGKLPLRLARHETKLHSSMTSQCGGRLTGKSASARRGCFQRVFGPFPVGRGKITPMRAITRGSFFEILIRLPSNADKGRPQDRMTRWADNDSPSPPGAAGVRASVCPSYQCPGPKTGTFLVRLWYVLRGGALQDNCPATTCESRSHFHTNFRSQNSQDPNNLFPLNTFRISCPRASSIQDPASPIQ